MIHALHLLWIVSLSAGAGAFCMTLVAASNRQTNKAPPVATGQYTDSTGIITT